MKPYVEEQQIFMTLAGSHMYGMATAASDIDKRGVCVPPTNVELGFARKFEQQEYPNEDTVVYGLRKFMKLAAECNPNILELLYAPEDSILKTSPTWEKLMEHRDEFLCAQAYLKFNGYAMGQLKRIRTHRAWLLSPPKGKPQRSDYGLGAQGTGVRELSKGVDVTEVDPTVIKVIEKEKRFKGALDQFNQYHNWKKNRNPVRAALEATNGYDTKHAAHLVRLLRMGNEILTKGTLIVRRPDAEDLLDIRRGKWTYDELMENVTPLQEEMKRVYQNEEYVIPARNNKESLSDLCCELYEYHWSGLNKDGN